MGEVETWKVTVLYAMPLNQHLSSRWSGRGPSTTLLSQVLEDNSFVMGWGI